MNNELISQETLDKWKKRVEREIKKLLKSKGHSATGELVESIKIVQNETGKKISLALTFSEHGKFVLSGRKRNRTMPPVSAIEDWLSVKGMDTTNAFGIAKHIGKRGIKAFDFAVPFRTGVAELSRELAKDIAAQLTRRLMIKISSIKKVTIK